MDSKIKLRLYQDDGVNRLRFSLASGRKAPLYVLPTGGGKCLARGTKILMYDGTVKPVEKVVAGDKLMGPDSTPRRVLSICRGQEQMYDIVPTKGESFRCNESHILSLKVTGGAKDKRYPAGSIVDIPVRDYLKLPKHTKHILKAYRVGVDFPRRSWGKLHPAIDPYFLGVWLGDGSSRSPAITSQDEEIHHYLLRYPASKGLKVRLEFTPANTYHLTTAKKSHGRGYRTNPITKGLYELGVLMNKHIPQSYKVNSRSVRLKVLAGLLDTDGHAHHNGFDYISKSHHLADDVAFIARSLGFAAYVKKCFKSAHKNHVGTYYRVSISGDLSEVPVLIGRKKAGTRKQKKNVLHTGITVKPAGFGDYYGFEIDGDRRFVLGDFTVTHNTIVFTYIAEQALRRGKRVFILVHRQELMLQASRKLAELGVPHGRIKSGQTWTRDSIQVASVDTLIRRLNKVEPPDLIIVDEGHHLVVGNKWGRVVEAFPNAVILGVSATPIRLDGTGLGQGAGGYYDDLILGPNVSDLIDAGYLTEAVVYAPNTTLDLSGVKMRGGDFEMKELGKRVDKPKITGDAVEHYRKLCPRVPAIAFCVTVEHARHVAEQFNAAGYDAACLDASSSDQDRKGALDMLADGRLQVVTSCELISEGTDVPICGAAILLRPTASEALYLQQVGRTMRPYPGKKQAIILDHVGNALRHGLPEDQRTWTLLGRPKRGKKQEGEPGAIGITRCMKCFAVFRNALSHCPQCGTEVPQATGRSAPELSDGELKKIEADQAARERRKQIANAKSFEELQELARQRGYKPGWAKHIWDARQKRVGA